MDEDEKEQISRTAASLCEREGEGEGRQRKRERERRGEKEREREREAIPFCGIVPQFLCGSISAIAAAISSVCAMSDGDGINAVESGCKVAVCPSRQ